jgi:hypothetical protein
MESNLVLVSLKFDDLPWIGLNVPVAAIAVVAIVQIAIMTIENVIA